jgi:hypothetical protein
MVHEPDSRSNRWLGNTCGTSDGSDLDFRDTGHGWQVAVCENGTTLANVGLPPYTGLQV